MVNISTQITTAETFGMIDHQQGINAPCQSKELMRMMDGRQIGETPKGEASSIALLDAWYKGWNEMEQITNR